MKSPNFNGNSLRILHITDMHFGRAFSLQKRGEKDAQARDQYNSIAKDIDQQRAGMIDNIKLMCNGNPNEFDLVILSGDFFWGAAQDREDVQKKVIDFIEGLKVTVKVGLDRFILCPGNHDIFEKSLRQDHHNFKYSPDKQNHLDPSSKDSFVQYFKYYNLIADQLGIPTLQTHDCYCCGLRTLKIKNFDVTVRVFNSSWHCGKNHSNDTTLTKILKDEGTKEAGRMVLGNLYAQACYTSVSKNEDLLPLDIAVLHHPPQFLYPRELFSFPDFGNFGKVLQNNHLVFTGHTHISKIERFAPYQIYGITGGPFYFVGPEHEQLSSFNVCEIRGPVKGNYTKAASYQGNIHKFEYTNDQDGKAVFTLADETTVVMSNCKIETQNIDDLQIELPQYHNAIYNMYTLEDDHEPEIPQDQLPRKNLALAEQLIDKEVGMASLSKLNSKSICRSNGEYTYIQEGIINRCLYIIADSRLIQFSSLRLDIELKQYKADITREQMKELLVFYRKPLWEASFIGTLLKLSDQYMGQFDRVKAFILDSENTLLGQPCRVAYHKYIHNNLKKYTFHLNLGPQPSGSFKTYLSNFNLSAEAFAMTTYFFTKREMNTAKLDQTYNEIYWNNIEEITKHGNQTNH